MDVIVPFSWWVVALFFKWPHQRTELVRGRSDFLRPAARPRPPSDAFSRGRWRHAAREGTTGQFRGRHYTLGRRWYDGGADVGVYSPFGGADRADGGDGPTPVMLLVSSSPRGRIISHQCGPTATLYCVRGRFCMPTTLCTRRWRTWVAF